MSVILKIIYKYICEQTDRTYILLYIPPFLKTCWTKVLKISLLDYLRIWTFHWLPYFLMISFGFRLLYGCTYFMYWVFWHFFGSYICDCRSWIFWCKNMWSILLLTIWSVAEIKKPALYFIFVTFCVPADIFVDNTLTFLFPSIVSDISFVF